MNYKEVLDLLKKVLFSKQQTLNKISAHHETLLRNQESLKKSENPVQINKYQNLIDTERESLQKTITQLEGYVQFVLNQERYSIYSLSRFKNRYHELLQILQLANKSYNTKEDLFEFGALIKSTTQMIFKDNQKLTEDIKIIKKQKK
ncbi:hypothetical protein FGO68_gene4122 [Halteria grandinella]|uniref:Uncharacterized protein n=1 Tax=Halteria grandinella TaxID=5974 RepID=A0A8J8NFZ1_HALGN|nr:hypothetical protein FGO68_gene4122 [Halteria grandinella]